MEELDHQRHELIRASSLPDTGPPPHKRARQQQQQQQQQQQRQTNHAAVAGNAGIGNSQMAKNDEENSSSVTHCPQNPLREAEYAYDEEEADPFPYALRCQQIPDVTRHQVLWWHSPSRPISLDVEQSLMGVLVKYGKRERGMYRNHPEHRVRQLERVCRERRIPVAAALSLRRHHIRRHNPHKPMTALGLGRDVDIRESARLFEICVQEFLSRSGIDFYSERQLKRHIQEHRRQDVDPYPPTPDFLMKTPVRIKKFVQDNGHRHHQHHRSRNNNRKQSGNPPPAEGNHKRVLREQSVCWIDAKMFYGASSIEADGKSAVGSLRSTAQKYVKCYGPGAMVFMQGYGDQLARDLEALGALVLGSDVLSLDRVWDHQRTWCSDASGKILP